MPSDDFWGMATFYEWKAEEEQKQLDEAEAKNTGKTTQRFVAKE